MNMLQILSGIHLNQVSCILSAGLLPSCRRAWQPTPVFLLGESPWMEDPGGLQSMGAKSWTRLSDYHCFVLVVDS